MDAVTGRLRQDQGRLEQAHQAVRVSADAIRQHWSGRAAEAMLRAHDALTESIKDKHSAVNSVVSASDAYGEAHESVKEQSRYYVTMLAEARQTIGTADNALKGPQTGSGAEEFIALAMRSKTAALVEEAEALARLRGLYEVRVEARTAFRSAIA